MPNEHLNSISGIILRQVLYSKVCIFHGYLFGNTLILGTYHAWSKIYLGHVWAFELTELWRFKPCQVSVSCADWGWLCCVGERPHQQQQLPIIVSSAQTKAAFVSLQQTEVCSCSVVTKFHSLFNEKHKYNTFVDRTVSLQQMLCIFWSC